MVFISKTIHSQNYQTVEEVDGVCSQLGFASDEEAQIAVDKILDEIGIPTKSFKLRSCPNINNAVAKNIKDANGNFERYILYDINFMKRISDNAQNDWSAISVLAHEIGHHLSGHSLNNQGSNHKFELEADYFSGVSLAKMGATLEEAQSAIQTLRYEKATSTHPAKADRLKEIEKGWNVGGGSNNTSVENTGSSKAFKEFSDQGIVSGKKIYNTRKVPKDDECLGYSQEIGGTNFNLYYSNLDTASDAFLLGNVFPFGEIWRTGGFESHTFFTFTEDIYIQDKLLKAGTYKLFSTPGNTSWTVYFSSDYRWNALVSWDPSKIALSLEVPNIEIADIQESLVIRLKATSVNSGELILSFEKSKFVVPFETATTAMSNYSPTRVQHQIGLTQVEVEYDNTISNIDTNFTTIVDKITFEDDVTLCDKEIKAGTYKVLGKRNKDTSLSIQFEQNNTKLGSTEIVGISKIDICDLRSLRTDRMDDDFFVAIYNLYDLGANLEIYLDKKKYKLPITVPTHKKVYDVIKNIEELGAATSNDYYSFSLYYYQNDLDISIAREYVEKAEKADTTKIASLAILKLKSWIYHKMGDTKEAIAIAKKALVVAKEENHEFSINSIQKNLKEWQ